MTAPTFVFVHGGQHTGACWRATTDALTRRRPEAHTLAVDLPGRRDEPGDLARLTIGQCVESVVRQIDAAGAERVVVVGHSMAGITIPGVIAALGAERVAHVVHIACCVPAQGRTVLSTLRPPVSWIAGAMSRLVRVSRPFPGPVAGWMFANGMTASQRKEVVAGLVPESSAIAREPVDRSDMPDRPTTWILTARDHSLRPRLQRQFIANLGNVDEVVVVDACHDVMISEPEELAELLLRITGDRSSERPRTDAIGGFVVNWEW